MAAAAEPRALMDNASLEDDRDADDWPDGWAKVAPGGAWLEEQGNHFLRLTSTEPEKMVMLYQEIKIPEGVEALEFRWKQRVTGLKVGKQSWFDARIMLEFMNAAREKVAPTPSAPATRQDTDGWVEKSTRFLVPEGATHLKFMACLFQVQSGVFDLDDLTIQEADPTPIRQAMEIAAVERLAKLTAQAESRRKKAAAVLEKSGSLITNGNFETDKNSDGWPDDWGRPKQGGERGDEVSNHFLKLTSPRPGEMVMVYRPVDIPAGVQALELSWRQRVSGLKKGTSPWFDARIMLEFLGVDGKKLAKNPSAPYSQKDTDGWVTRSTSFLVPDEALTLVLMPCLFQANAGTFELDDFVLKPTDPEVLVAAAKKRAAEIEARHVPPEEPDRANWPPVLKVVGNRLHDPEGHEVWLQGVNAGGLETLPQDRQPIKSTVVAIEEWKSNCVRVPMNETFWYGRSPYQKDGGKEYREILDQIITLAANRGAYVVIDLHRFRAPKPEHAEFWKDFAARYKDHPAVLFDLFNEPHGISWDVWKNGGFVGEKSGVDESAFVSEEEKKKNQGFESIGMQGLVDAVRGTGAKNIVIAGGLFWCNDLSGITQGYALDDRGGNGVVYSWHTYNWHTDWEAKMLATAEKHPVFLGEVGADIHKMDFIPAEAQEDPYTWVPDMLGFIQKHRINWTGWCLHPKATPVMISDWSYTPTPYWGEFAKEALSGKQFELKRTR
ncbi:MAG: glycoside hydrolase family 5 protein [Planctomycetaceae bacterium]|nr:glycoside hydrolase family 5 protein [Planctomycetaceae bacterium]